MVEHLLAIDDVADDFEKILRWAIEFKRAWKNGDDVAQNFIRAARNPIAGCAEPLILESSAHRALVAILQNAALALDVHGETAEVLHFRTRHNFTNGAFRAWHLAF